VHINLDNRAPSDFVVVVSPNSQIEAPPPVAKNEDESTGTPTTSDIGSPEKAVAISRT
jgi:hypothetical protein